MNGFSRFELFKLSLEFLGAIPDGTLSSRRVVPHPSSPIYVNVTIWIQNRWVELKLGPNRSVSVQITFKQFKTIKTISKVSNISKIVFLTVPYLLIFQLLLKITRYASVYFLNIRICTLAPLADCAFGAFACKIRASSRLNAEARKRQGNEMTLL